MKSSFFQYFLCKSHHYLDHQLRRSALFSACFSSNILTNPPFDITTKVTSTKSPKMQLTIKECMLLAFIFLASPAVGTMVNGAPVPIDARNDINRLQANPVIEQRAAASSAAAQGNSGGGLLGMIGKLAPFAEDLLPMIGLRDLDTRDNADAAAHNKAVEELKSKLINDPNARQKLYQVITKVAGSTPTPALAQRDAPATTASSQSSGGGGLLGIIGQLAPYAEDLLPMIGLRDLDGIEARSPANATTASSQSSGGGGLLGIIGQLAPYAEDLLPMIGLRDLGGIEARSPANTAASHEQAVAELNSKLINDPNARKKLYQILTKASSATAAPTTTH
jgi:hypothetical protein